MWWNVSALALSVLALVGSTRLTLRQSTLMHNANHLPVYFEFMALMRSVKFYDDYQFIIDKLGGYEPQLGISGLPSKARSAVYSIGGYYQGLAMLHVLEIIDQRFLLLARPRIIRCWEAVAPYVERERELQNVSGVYLWRSLEELVKDLRELPDDSLNRMISRSRRRQRHAGRRLLKTSARAEGLHQQTPQQTGSESQPRRP